MVRIDDDDFTPRVSIERPRRSLTLPMSPLLIIDGLSRKSSSYSKLPDEPINLSVVKLDGSFFDVQVTKTATVAQLKQAVEAVFSHMPQNGPGKISWSCSLTARSPSISCEEEKNDKDYFHVVDIEKGKLLHYDDDEGFIEQRETRLTRFIGRWLPCSRLAAVDKRRVQELAFPSRLTTSLLGGFRKIVRLCCDKCYTRRGAILLCCDSRRRNYWRKY
ncbi:hypothetical protein FNV43_RR12284 [Rhamnella rubrinervis]|uniref:SNRNP25 ubiquitin-like domain-containing protein n=1 Tax=Rhamnella rubrinervis TaxID=2594499 RepID=A0A8K0H7X3_9ROSA|nr:hypothetical protein FNV43_RR12284 [Rhamnella rubrinervis]